jgi:hypothetical protein
VRRLIPKPIVLLFGRSAPGIALYGLRRGYSGETLMAGVILGAFVIGVAAVAISVFQNDSERTTGR